MNNLLSKIKQRIISIALLVVAFSSLLLSGCNFDAPVVYAESIGFVQDAITLQIGDSLILDDSSVKVLPYSADDLTYTISIDDDEVLTLASKTITGKKAGTCIVTVSANGSSPSNKLEASVEVIVLNNYPESLTIEAEGSMTQYVNSITPIYFTANYSSASVPIGELDDDIRVDWYVNDSLVSAEVSLFDSYCYAPTNSAGIYTVEARSSIGQSDTYYASTDVRIYQAISSKVLGYSGSLYQEETPYTTVTFTTTYTNVLGNPLAVIDWYVDGVRQSSDNVSLSTESSYNVNSFKFTPSGAGTFVITAYLNGNLVYTSSSSSSLSVVVKGPLVANSIVFNFDDFYPKLMLSWDSSSNDDNGSYAIKITTSKTDPLQERTIVEDYTEFTGTSVDLSSLIGDEKTYNIFNSQFKIYVKSLDNEYYQGGEYSDPIITEQVGDKAKEYLLKTYYNGYRNYYASSVEELADIFAYTRLYRQEQYELTAETIGVYVGFSYDSFSDVLKEATSLKSGVGIFNYTYTITSRTILEVTITYKTDGLPTVSTEGNALYPKIGTTRPSVNYSSSLIRPSATHTFKIDNRSESVVVSTTEQLYTAAEEGFRPVPMIGSDAETYYNQIKTILRYIIPYTQEDNDFYKIHAIYDYIIWRVSYDHSVTAYLDDTATGIKYTSFYLEGVFNSDRPFAVCDGISKAFSLMCNMEGIDAMRIVGSVGGVGHAWNKVSYNNKWYIVDCTFGNTSLALPSAVSGTHPTNKTATKYEVGSHEYLFKTDAQLSTHVEDTPNLYPSTTTVPLNFYDEYEVYYSGSYLDFYIDSSSYVTETRSLVNYMLSQKPSSYSYYVGPQVASNLTTSSFYSYEIRVNSNYSHYFTYSNTNNPIVSAMCLRTLVLNTDYYLVYTQSSTDNFIVYIFIKHSAIIDKEDFWD